MLVDLVNRLIALGHPVVAQHNGLTYSNKELHLIAPPEVVRVGLVTLTGLVDLIRARLDDLSPADWVLLVENHEQVFLLPRKATTHGSRAPRMRAHLADGQPFQFGQFLNREEFVIGLLSKFVPGGDTEQVLQLASSLQAELVTIAEDDGISQKTTIRQGAVLKQRTIVKGRVTLRPYRTFREVEQPASEFVFRLRSQDGEVPTCALFEADGGKWKLDAVLTIKKWLEEQQLGIPVVA